LGGRLIGELQQSGSTSTTNFFLTDNLGSVMAVFNSVSSSAALLSTQLYAPYGASRFTAGTPSNYTNKGYTGQYNDTVSGLDYYNARYYDPVSGVFLSADTVEGNDSGMNPYAYAGGNPATYNDPSGERYTECLQSQCGEGGPTDVADPPVTPTQGQGDPWWYNIPTPIKIVIAVGLGFLGITYITHTGTPSSQSGGPQPTAVPTPTATPIPTNGASLSSPVNHDMPTPDSPLTSAVYHDMPTPTPSTQTGSGGANPPGGGHPPTLPAGDPCSFTPNTQVATVNGEQPIGKLHVGEKVWAYNPKTKQMELQPIEHVWIHQDSDLVDLTITYQKPAQHGKADAKGQTTTSEVVHTTSEHPFYTTGHGFTPAGKLKAGMHILRADGSVGVVAQVRLVHKTQTMYNLEVAHDHTFVVGSGQWVVHNKCGPEDYKQLRENMEESGIEFKPGQQAHHIIPCALENHPLIQATDGLFDKNAAYNGRALFGNDYQEEALQDGEPYHWFHNKYTARVRVMMNQAYQNLAESGALNEPGYGQQIAMTSLLEIIASLDTDIIQQGLTSVWTNVACLLS
jgi:RHS repeat-associated protein